MILYIYTNYVLCLKSKKAIGSFKAIYLKDWNYIT